MRPFEQLLRKLELFIPDRFRLVARHHWLSLNGRLDNELLLAARIFPENQNFIDVGANFGTYSYHLKEQANQIVAFEPLPDASRYLQAAKIKNLIIHNVALSNEDGEQILNIPTRNNKPVYALSSFQKIYKDHIEIKVAKRKLDNYSLQNIGLIKIDVEGHEMAVLEGAVETITKNMPVLLIEIETRHTDHSVSKPVSFLKKLGYRCFFIENKSIMPFVEFNQDKHQNLNNICSENYINNFIFVSEELENNLYECMEFFKKI